MTRRVRRSSLGLLGAALLLFAAGCPDTSLGTTSAASPDAASPDAASDHPTIEWRQTLDISTAGMNTLSGWLRFAAGGKRAYVLTWAGSAGLMTVTDGLLSAPTKLPTDGGCNLADIRVRADEQVVLVGSYYKWAHVCGQAIGAFNVQSDGRFGPGQLDTAFEGAFTTDPLPPDFSDDIALHPTEAWLYIGFANTYPSNATVTADSQIGRVDVAPDGSLSNETLFDLDSGDTGNITLGFSKAGDALFAVQRETGRVNRLHVDGVTGDLTTPAVVATVGERAEIGPVCMIGGKEHVYVGSAPYTHDDPTGGIHHLQFDGTALSPAASVGASQHPGLFRVHSIVADAECRYLFAVGEKGTTQAVLHVLKIDPTTGDPVWVSALDGVAQMVLRYRISMSPDGRFLYTVGSLQNLLHVFEIVAP